MLQETLWLYSGYQEQLGATGIQIQYNYVTLFTKLCSVMFDAYRPVGRIIIRGLGYMQNIRRPRLLNYYEY